MKLTLTEIRAIVAAGVARGREETRRDRAAAAAAAARRQQSTLWKVDR